ncbi:hypothetical protein ABEF95_003478 [Exophiala dermatitidis]
MTGIRGLQNPLAVLLAAFMFPLSTLLLLINYAYMLLVPQNNVRRHLLRTPGFIPRTILLTGINTPQGLRLARAFYETGHHVIGADYEPGRLLVPARFSTALRRFYRLESTFDENWAMMYVSALVDIIRKERVDVWINCANSGDSYVECQARQAIEQHTNCRGFALRMENAPHFLTQEAFLTYVESLGLPVPERRLVNSRDEVHQALNKTHGRRKYLLQSVGEDNLTADPTVTVLPRRTLSQTYNTIACMPIQKSKPWLLKQVTEGLKKHSTFAIVVNRTVMAFVAFHNTNYGSYEALDPKSSLAQSMLRFVQTFASKQDSDSTGHFGIDFCVEQHIDAAGVQEKIIPLGISCHAQHGVLFFDGLAGSAQLARSYLASISSEVHKTNGHLSRSRSSSILVNSQEFQNQDVAFPTGTTPGIYRFGPDLQQRCLASFARVLTFDITPTEFFKQFLTFLKHLLFWQEELYSFTDPMPFWWTYQIYIPLQHAFAMYMGIRGVSTPELLRPFSPRAVMIMDQDPQKHKSETWDRPKEQHRIVAA